MPAAPPPSLVASSVRWAGAGAEALEEARALGWQGVCAIEYGRRCYGRRGGGWLVAVGVGIVFQEGRKVGPILVPPAAIWRDGRRVFLHDYPPGLLQEYGDWWLRA